MIQQTLFHTSVIKSSSILSDKKILIERKQNGVFYTPQQATQILSQWAIQNANDIVLEPSFGGCGFLVASRNRLIALGNSQPEDHLYGCDIDECAFGILRDIFVNPDIKNHFRKIDFLKTSQLEFPLVNVIIGNPPYVSLHNMSGLQRKAAHSLAKSHDINIDGKASLWVYFILHSLTLIKQGGRMAWILPGSFIHADYSEPLRKKLSSMFGRCIAIFLEERIFIEAGTEESSVVLLCEDFGNNCNSIEFDSVRNLIELDNIIKRWNNHNVVENNLLVRPQLAMIPATSKECYNFILQQATTHRFAEFADIKIGLVTGANKFFVLNEKQVEHYNLPEEVIEPILAKFSQSCGLEVSNEDLNISRAEGKRCLLVNSARSKRIPEALNNYLNAFPEDKKSSNYTFKKTRSVWHKFDNKIRPDGFFSSMQSEGPTLLLNTARTTCTNTVYQVSFLLGVSSSLRKALAISLQSTFSQLSAEIEGRIYGGGALKLEPSEVKKLAVMLPHELVDMDVVFTEVDNYLRRGNRAAARRLVDQFLIEQNLLTIDQLFSLEEGLQRLRSIRNGYRKANTL